MRSSAASWLSLNPSAALVPHDEYTASISPIMLSAAKRVMIATYLVIPAVRHSASSENLSLVSVRGRRSSDAPDCSML